MNDNDPAPTVSLGDIIAAALLKNAVEAPRPHPVGRSFDSFIFGDDRELLVCALAKVFCGEMEQHHGMLAEDVWDVLETVPELHDKLFTVDGWATLSAYVTGGAFVMRLPLVRGEA